MPKLKLDRRTLLRGMLGGAGVAIGLPLLDIFLNDHGDALAQGSPVPARFGWWFWGNGMLPDKWDPPIDGSAPNPNPAWTLTEQLLPLASVKDDITLISGMQVKVVNDSPHKSGPSGILAGGSVVGPPDIGDNSFPGPSIDQLVAAEIGGTTRFRSIEYAAERNSRSFSHNGLFNTNPAEMSPWALFNRVFGDGFTLPGQTPVIDPRWALRRSVLDVVADQSTRLRTGLGVRDRQRLDQYYDGLRALELQLARLELDPPSLDSCNEPGELPAAPEADYPDLDGRQQLSARHRAMADVMTMALACDQTRVFSCMFSQPVSGLLYFDHDVSHHSLTHDEGVGQDQPKVNDIVKLTMGELAYFVEKLRSVPEGDGTLLDNMLLFATSDSSFGRAHALTGYPMILAGSAGGALRTGVHYRSPSESTSKAVLTMMRAVGVPLTSFGIDDAATTSGLGAIEAV